MKNVKQFSSRLVVAGLSLSLILPQTVGMAAEPSQEEVLARLQTAADFDAEALKGLNGEKTDPTSRANELFDQIQKQSEAQLAAAKAEDKKLEKSIAKSREEIGKAAVINEGVATLKALEGKVDLKAKELAAKREKDTLDNLRNVAPSSAALPGLRKARHEQCNAKSTAAFQGMFQKGRSEKFGAANFLNTLERMQKEESEEKKAEFLASFEKANEEELKAALFSQKSKQEKEDLAAKWSKLSKAELNQALAKEAKKVVDPAVKNLVTFLQGAGQKAREFFEAGDNEEKKANIFRQMSDTMSAWSTAVGEHLALAAAEPWSAAANTLKSEIGINPQRLGSNKGLLGKMRKQAKEVFDRNSNVATAAAPGVPANQNQAIVQSEGERVRRENEIRAEEERGRNLLRTSSGKDQEANVRNQFAALNPAATLQQGVQSTETGVAAVRKVISDIETSSATALAQNVQSSQDECDRLQDYAEAIKAKAEASKTADASAVQNNEALLGGGQSAPGGFRGGSAQGVPVQSVAGSNTSFGSNGAAHSGAFPR